VTTISEIITRWDAGDGKPYKGSLIDWKAYEAEPDGLGCMCAQGQVLHLIGGRSFDDLRNMQQQEADRQTAALLNISRAHAILLRQVNDSVDGAPSIVLTDPGKVLGNQWSKLLDFWWHLDQMTAKARAAAGAAARDAAWAAARAAAGAAARDAAWDAAWAAAGDAARDAAGDAAWAAAGDAAWAAAGDAAGAAARDAAGEIQGAAIFRAAKRPFYFLPLFGFADPAAIPARPANYGVPA
jgi:hypothetical protein